MAIFSRNKNRGDAPSSAFFSAGGGPSPRRHARRGTDRRGSACADRPCRFRNQRASSIRVSSEQAMYRGFRGDLSTAMRYVPTIARYGRSAPPPRSASGAQLAAFGDLRSGPYLARKYGARFAYSSVAEIGEVRDARELKNFFEVRSTVDLRGQSPFSVSFMVSDRVGREPASSTSSSRGVSLLKSERVEIGSMLERRGRQYRPSDRDLRFRPDARRSRANLSGRCFPEFLLDGPFEVVRRRGAAGGPLLALALDGPHRAPPAPSSAGTPGAGPRCTRTMVSRQISAGRPPPVTPLSGVFSS